MTETIKKISAFVENEIERCKRLDEGRDIDSHPSFSTNGRIGGLKWVLEMLEENFSEGEGE